MADSQHIVPRWLLWMVYVIGALAVLWCVAFVALAIYAIATAGPLGECIPGADPPIRLAHCEGVQP